MGWALITTLCTLCKLCAVSDQTPCLMEVHSHTHTPRKKWTHYFWEFMMLFLAVTLGFFVENEREHYIEKTRARELAKNLLEDLKSDTASMHQISRIRSEKILTIDTLLSDMRNYPASANIPKIYQHVYSIIYKIHFKRADGTVNQLKNSGYLRYFSKTAIPEKLMEYDRIVGGLMEFEITYSNNLDIFAYLAYHHLDADINLASWADPLNPMQIPAYASLYDMDKLKLNYFKNIAASLKHLNVVSVNFHIAPSEKKAIELMNIIREKYHFK